MAPRKRKRKLMVEPIRRTTRRVGGRTSAAQASVASTLPGWDSLSGTSRPKSRSVLVTGSAISTAQFAIWLFGAALLVTAYVGHVHATQTTFEEVHALRKERLQLVLTRDRLKGELDLATGPTVIYRKAQELGLREGFSYGPTIKLPPNQ